MRNRLVIVTAALALAFATFAGAQTPAPQTTPAAAPESKLPMLGSIDFGGLFGDTDGDTARYERYRDTRNGVYSDINLVRNTDKYSFNATANHVGYRDQKYTVGYDSRRVNFGFFFDSIPLNYYYGALSPWTHDGSTTLSLDPAIRNAVQGPTNATNDGTAVGVPCAPGAPPAACGNPTQAAQALANRSAYNNVSTLVFDMQSKRQTFGLGGTVFAAKDVGVNVAFSSTKKSGEMPWGASFAFNNANEVPQPIDNRTNDVSTGVEYVKPKGMVRFGWDGSWFSNGNKTLIWDNPIRATNFSNGLTPPSGPYDPNGYSNGNGPAQGRMALWPDNSMQTFTGTGLYKLSRGTSINGTLQYRTQDQNETLIPWTINPVIANPTVYAAFPHLASLPRTSAEAGASGINTLLNFSTRPWQRLGIQAKYRYNKRDVNTPHFDASEWVRFDAVPEEAEHSESEQFDVTRSNFDANALVSLLGYGALKVGYAHEGYEREGRGFSDTGENTFRLSYDAMGLPFLAVRAQFDYSARRGDGFVLAGVDYESGLGGEQPGLRYYDEADRNRTKGSFMISANPTDLVSIYLQFAAGRDEFLADESIPEGREFFGLLDQNFYSWNFGASVNPNDRVSFGANYGYDKYSSLQKSRNAGPNCKEEPPCPSSGYNQWEDPRRDWTLDNDEAVNNFNVYLDLFQAFRNVDIRFAYDFSNSDNALVHGGPRIAALNTNTPIPGDLNAATGAQLFPCPTGVSDCFTPLPNVTNTWHRFTADLKFFFTRQIGAGLGIYYEKFDISDFATIDANGSVGFTTPTDTPRLDYLGELVTGYMNRPYSGVNVFARLLYRF